MDLVIVALGLAFLVWLEICNRLSVKRLWDRVKALEKLVSDKGEKSVMIPDYRKTMWGDD